MILQQQRDDFSVARSIARDRSTERRRARGVETRERLDHAADDDGKGNRGDIADVGVDDASRARTRRAGRDPRRARARDSRESMRTREAQRERIIIIPAPRVLDPRIVSARARERRVRSRHARARDGAAYIAPWRVAHSRQGDSN